MSELRVVFDGPPGPEGGRFVECENARGESVTVGEWRKRDDGRWELLLDQAEVHPMFTSTQFLEDEDAAFLMLASTDYTFARRLAELLRARKEGLDPHRLHRGEPAEVPP